MWVAISCEPRFIHAFSWLKSELCLPYGHILFSLKPHRFLSAPVSVSDIPAVPVPGYLCPWTSLSPSLSQSLSLDLLVPVPKYCILCDSIYPTLCRGDCLKCMCRQGESQEEERVYIMYRENIASPRDENGIHLWHGYGYVLELHTVNTECSLSL